MLLIICFILSTLLFIKSVSTVNQIVNVNVHGESLIYKSKLPMISINTATKEELMTLPNIGDVLAERIVQARPYSSIEELRNINGIGIKTMSLIRELIKL